MIAGLERFVSDLRKAGLAVSPGDFIVAVRAVELVGLEDRRRLAAALGAALCKRREDRPRFDEVFECHFASRRLAGAPGERPQGEGRGRGLPRLDRASGFPPRSYLEQLREKQGRSPMRLRRVIRRPAGPPREGQLRPRAGPPRAPIRVAGAVRSKQTRPSLLDHEQALARELPRLIARLRLGAGRRLRRARRGRLWLRRIFRENLSPDGVPWNLPRRRVAPRRPRVVLLLDVSWSTALATGLFLAIAVGLLSRLRRTRVLFFVDRIVDGTEEVERWMRGGAAAGGISFSQVLNGLAGLRLDAPSDYGRAFSALARSPRRPTGRTTALLVLGDGRSNHLDPQEWAFEELVERCGAVLWLVPEPAERWGSGDSALEAYLPHADVVVEAADLEGLARGVAELARRL